jgi:Uma2 family endonuclease
MQPGDRIPMSWDEYATLDPSVRGDYIDGALVVAAAPGGRHQDISRRLANLIEAVLPPTAHVHERWAWKPEADEFVPDLMLFDRSDAHDDRRLTAVPHLVVEVLSTDRAADMIRRAHKYAAVGLQRYWIIDPEGPEIIVHQGADGRFTETGRYGPGTSITLDAGPVEIAFDPAQLLD